MRKKKIGKLVGHLPLGENGKFAKNHIYFLRTDQFGRCDITVTGKAVNLGDGDGIQVLCSKLIRAKVNGRDFEKTEAVILVFDM